MERGRKIFKCRRKNVHWRVVNFQIGHFKLGEGIIHQKKKEKGWVMDPLFSSYRHTLRCLHILDPFLKECGVESGGQNSVSTFCILHKVAAP